MVKLVVIDPILGGRLKHIFHTKNYYSQINPQVDINHVF